MLQSVRTEERIQKSAAHLVAAIADPTYGVALNHMTQEVRDSLDMLCKELNETELLDPYRREGGKLAVW